MMDSGEATIHKVLLLLITTRNLAEIKRQCTEKLGLSPGQTVKAIEEASGQIAAAAVWNRDIEAGKSLLRLDDLYERSLRVQDIKTALVAERDRAKLVGLHKPKAIDETDNDRDSELETVIREHLGPLELAPPETPVEELLRLAALKIIGIETRNEFNAVTKTPLEAKDAEKRPQSAPGKDAAAKSRKIGEKSRDLADAGGQKSGPKD